MAARSPRLQLLAARLRRRQRAQVVLPREAAPHPEVVALAAQALDRRRQEPQVLGARARRRALLRMAAVQPAQAQRERSQKAQPRGPASSPKPARQSSLQAHQSSPEGRQAGEVAVVGLDSPERVGVLGSLVGALLALASVLEPLTAAGEAARVWVLARVRVQEVLLMAAELVQRVGLLG